MMGSNSCLYVRPLGVASKSRNGAFILMEFLLATLLTCEEANGIIDKIKPSTENRTELVQMVQMSAEKECFPEDAHD